MYEKTAVLRTTVFFAFLGKPEGVGLSRATSGNSESMNEFISRHLSTHYIRTVLMTGEIWLMTTLGSFSVIWWQRLLKCFPCIVSFLIQTKSSRVRRIVPLCLNRLDASTDWQHTITVHYVNIALGHFTIDRSMPYTLIFYFSLNIGQGGRNGRESQLWQGIISSNAFWDKASGISWRSRCISVFGGS